MQTKSLEKLILIGDSLTESMDLGYVDYVIEIDYMGDAESGKCVFASVRIDWLSAKGSIMGVQGTPYSDTYKPIYRPEDMRFVFYDSIGVWNALVCEIHKIESYDTELGRSLRQVAWDFRKKIKKRTGVLVSKPEAAKVIKGVS